MPRRLRRIPSVIQSTRLVRFVCFGQPAQLMAGLMYFGTCPPSRQPPKTPDRSSLPCSNCTCFCCPWAISTHPKMYCTANSAKIVAWLVFKSRVLDASDSTNALCEAATSRGSQASARERRNGHGIHIAGRSTGRFPCEFGLVSGPVRGVRSSPLPANDEPTLHRGWSCGDNKVK